VNQKNGVRTIASLALLLVTLVLYGCSPTSAPQIESKVIDLQPEIQDESNQAVVEEEIEEAPAAQTEVLAAAPAVEQPAQPETAGGIGGGAAESQSFAQSEPAPQPEANAKEAAPAPQVEQPVSTVEPTIGSFAPEFSLQTMDGQPVQLSALRGKNVLISYWVTWCIPCIEELPVLNRIYDEYQAQNLVILSVNGIQQDEIGTVSTTISDLGISMPVVLDQGDALWNSYWVRFLPTSFFIDEDGVIRHIQLGSLSEENLRIKIEQLISNQL
jgi:peroxiredoxin